MGKRSAYQQKVIKNYYDNKDAIMLQRLGELVTDLYLAEGKKRESTWKRVESTLEKLGVSKKRIDHLHEADNPSMLANLLKELMEKDS